MAWLLLRGFVDSKAELSGPAFVLGDTVQAS
jgi:hypothetical protein